MSGTEPEVLIELPLRCGYSGCVAQERMPACYASLADQPLAVDEDYNDDLAGHASVTGHLRVLWMDLLYGGTKSVVQVKRLSI